MLQTRAFPKVTLFSAYWTPGSHLNLATLLALASGINLWTFSPPGLLDQCQRLVHRWAVKAGTLPLVCGAVGGARQPVGWALAGTPGGGRHNGVLG